MKRFYLSIIILVLFGLLFGNMPAWADSAEEKFSFLPGALSFEKAGFRLEVPPNVFNQSVSIKAEDLDVSKIDELENIYVTKAIELYITNKNSQNIGNLSRTVRIAFTFNEIDYKRASRLNTDLSVGYFRIGYWDDSKKDWVQLSSSVFWNGSNGVVEAETDHGKGRYALLWTYDEDSQLSKIFVDGIRMMINYTTVNTDAQPYLKNDRTMVPLRLIAENLGARVEWNSSEQRVDLTRGTDNIQLWIGVLTAKKNGQSITLEAAPEVMGERTFVPMRFVAEALGGRVSWDELTQTAKVLSN
ncbi:MAG: hypothetical protein A4E53_00855 [Pelotomaculum sp. PtaB.Bin104]|nr:MAG: hypothetical protein A4E53_00855 [Pelotomaculum sp. PtaB.Bin104]